MRRTNQLALIALAVSLLIGCEKESKYDRPDWLAGKVYTQIEDSAIFSTFVECLKITGYDTLINTSGSYSVFVPNNDAFQTFFQEHGYSSPEDVPIKLLTDIVKYHIVQNPWSKEQLRSLDVWGWIDPTDETNDEPKGFKRETLLKESNLRYGVRSNPDRTNASPDEEKVIIVDTLSTNWKRRVFTDSRKFVPFFYKEYFDIYDLKLSDFTFYFGRNFENNDDIYFHDAKILGDEIFAENGFVYNIDRVVMPVKNAYEILEEDYPDKSYSKFLEMVNKFPRFGYNETETNAQESAQQGLDHDSLFDLTFPELTFNLTRERTKAPPGSTGLPGNVTIRYHHSMIAPTNTALEKLEAEYLPGGFFWDGIDNSPQSIQRIIINAHLAQNVVYQTDITNGFYNGEQDMIFLDESSIVQKEFASNAGFIGVDDPIVPRAFSSVTGPIYLRKGYARVMQAIEASGLLPALKRERDPGQEYMLFVEKDENTTADSSLLYETTFQNTLSWFAFQITGSSAQRVGISRNDLRTLLLNHIATRQPTGIPKREFILNLAGNYMIFNNETGEVRGNGKTTQGYLGTQNVQVIPERIDIDADNGSTWDISDWFTYSATQIYGLIQVYFPQFHNLIIKAGLANTLTAEYTFLTTSENYTIFVPSAQALVDVQADTLEGDDLSRFVLSHFIRREMIFTDDYAKEGYYETLAPNDDGSGNIMIHIDPNVDQIDLIGNNGTPFTSVMVSDSTNILAGQILGQGGGTFPATINDGVIHKLDKAILIDQMDISK